MRARALSSLPAATAAMAWSAFGSSAEAWSVREASNGKWVPCSAEAFLRASACRLDLCRLPRVG